MKPIFGNPDHIETVKQDRIKADIEEQEKDLSLYEVEVDISFSGTASRTYKIRAEDNRQAKILAREEASNEQIDYENETHIDQDISIIDITEVVADKKCPATFDMFAN
jgi:hypothetical protein